MRRDVATSALGILLGSWYLASAFMWPHTAASRADAIALGIATAAIALLAYRTPGARWLYLAPAAWIAASIWIIPHQDRFTIWNDGMMAIALVLVPASAAMFQRGGQTRAPA